MLPWKLFHVQLKYIPEESRENDKLMTFFWFLERARESFQIGLTRTRLNSLMARTANATQHDISFPWLVLPWQDLGDASIRSRLAFVTKSQMLLCLNVVRIFRIKWPHDSEVFVEKYQTHSASPSRKCPGEPQWKPSPEMGKNFPSHSLSYFVFVKNDLFWPGYKPQNICQVFDRMKAPGNSTCICISLFSQKINPTFDESVNSPLEKSHCTSWFSAQNKWRCQIKAYM